MISFAAPWVGCQNGAAISPNGAARLLWMTILIRKSFPCIGLQQSPVRKPRLAPPLLKGYFRISLADFNPSNGEGRAFFLGTGQNAPWGSIGGGSLSSFREPKEIQNGSRRKNHWN
jgi:hypothetical protein